MRCYIRSSRSRKFTASDGREYRWGYGMEADQEWTVSGIIDHPSLSYPLLRPTSLFQCVNVDDEVVAHYSLKHPNRPAYSTSGNVFTVYEAFAHLSTGKFALSTYALSLVSHLR